MMKSCCVVLALVGLCAATEQATVTQPLSVLGNWLTTSVGVGTPPQYFDLYLDTSDDKLVIADTKTANSDFDYQYNYIKNLFVPESSNTLNQSQSICRRGYNDGSHVRHIDGIYSEDVFTLGGNTYDQVARFCELNHPRTASDVSYDPAKWFQDMKIDGFLGLKPGGEEILEKLGFESRQISFRFNADSKEPDNSGFITFGGPDTKNCKSFRNFPADDYDTWRTMVTQVSFNNKDSKDVYSTRFEFHNQTLVVPKDVYNHITSYFSGQTTNIACSSYPSIPDITLNIYGHDYTYPLQRQFKPMSSSTYYCQIDIDYSSDSDDDQIVLNRHIMDKHCLLFDYDNGVIGLSDLAS